MKREIKFRIWNGSKMEYNVMVGFLGSFYVQGIDEKDTASMSPFNTKYPDPIAPMEFTGLKDKNLKDIYEGDILRLSDNYEHPVRKVEFFKGCFWFMAIGEDWKFPINMIVEDHLESMFIVGNIYETPELLTKTETK